MAKYAINEFEGGSFLGIKSLGERAAKEIKFKRKNVFFETSLETYLPEN